MAELYHDRAKGVQLETIDRLCTYLDIRVGDLLFITSN
ncbi:MAG TPA: helix-turn-helix transcriptional regulator [Desulfitobacteriaceae bacterium]|nr:helix-turn-helix transcriptional regulator [Desulfitobacteriaceae bacterium]